MTHIICGINLSCCSLNQVLYNGCVTPTSSLHQSSGSKLHMRRVDQYNTHELLTVSNIIITQSFVTGPVTCDSITVHVMMSLCGAIFSRLNSLKIVTKITQFNALFLIVHYKLSQPRNNDATK